MNNCKYVYSNHTKKGGVMNLISRKDVWNNGFVELWDFSDANSNNKNREEACAIVSEVCRGKKIANPKKHYQRLLTEHNGKPSEILQFIPIVEPDDKENFNPVGINNYWRFGYFNDDKFYTNLRNYATGEMENRATLASWLPTQIFNTKEDCKNFVVFKLKLPLMVLEHFRRHGMISNMMAQNEQSNRSKHKVEYYINDELEKAINDDYQYTLVEDGYDAIEIMKFISMADCEHLKEKYKIRQELLNKGAEGLRYTTIFFAGWLSDSAVWDNFFSVRLEKSTQRETREMSYIMYAMLQKHYNYQV
jgi:hypothetical protein